MQTTASDPLMKKTSTASQQQQAYGISAEFRTRSKLPNLAVQLLVLLLSTLSMKMLGKDFALKTKMFRIPETSANQPTKTRSHHPRTETRLDLDCGLPGCDVVQSCRCFGRDYRLSSEYFESRSGHGPMYLNAFQYLKKYELQSFKVLVATANDGFFSKYTFGTTRQAFTKQQELTRNIDVYTLLPLLLRQ